MHKKEGEERKSEKGHVRTGNIGRNGSGDFWGPRSSKNDTIRGRFEMERDGGEGDRSHKHRKEGEGTESENKGNLEMCLRVMGIFVTNSKKTSQMAGGGIFQNLRWHVGKSLEIYMGENWHF